MLQRFGTRALGLVTVQVSVGHLVSVEDWLAPTRTSDVLEVMGLDCTSTIYEEM